MIRRRVFGVLGIVVLVGFGFLGGWIVGRAALGEGMDPSTLPVVEQAFINQMNGAAMVGYFTVRGSDTRAASPDRYDIYSVEKVADDRWRFRGRTVRGRRPRASS